MFKNWQFLFLFLLATCIPYGITYFPYTIIALFLWGFSGDYKNFKLPKTGWFWIFCCFFILHLIGILYSKNTADAISITKAESGFVFFPLLLNTYSLKREEFNKILQGFCFSNILLAAFLIARALLSSLISKCPIYTYSAFSWFIHPSYCALYMIFSIFILYLGGFQLSQSPRKDFYIKSVLSTILYVAVLFCCSKIGLITMAMAILFFGIYFIIRLKSAWYIFIFVLLFSSVSFLFVNTISMLMLRLDALVNTYEHTKGMDYYNLEDFNKESIEKGMNQQESTLARIFIWNSAIPVIKSHLLFGVGTGDAISSMVSYAKNLGLDTLQNNQINNVPGKEHLFLSVVYSHANYNMHNQYIQTQIELGLPGLFLLLFLTFGALIFSFIKKDLLLSVFSILIILNFIVESMFQWDYFVLFFSAFLYMFIQVNTAEDKPSL